MALLTTKRTVSASDLQGETAKVRGLVRDLETESERLAAAIKGTEAARLDSRFNRDVLGDGAAKAEVEKLSARLTELTGEHKRVSEELAQTRLYLVRLENPTLEAEAQEATEAYQRALAEEDRHLRAELAALAALMDTRATRRSWYREAVNARAEANSKRKRLGLSELPRPADLSAGSRIRPAGELLTGSADSPERYVAAGERLRDVLGADSGAIRRRGGHRPRIAQSA